MECEVGSAISDSRPRLDQERPHLCGWPGPVREHIALQPWPGGSRTHLLRRKQASSNWALGQRQTKKSGEAGVLLGSCLRDWEVLTPGWTRGGAAEPMAQMPARTPKTEVWRGHCRPRRELPGGIHGSSSQPEGPTMAPEGVPELGEAAAEDQAGPGQTSRRNERPSAGFREYISPLNL